MGLSHWKGKPVIALEVWFQIRGQLSSRLEYFPDDFRSDIDIHGTPGDLFV